MPAIFVASTSGSPITGFSAGSGRAVSAIYSGVAYIRAGIQLKAAKDNTSEVYIGFSGNLTGYSGNLTDGMELGAGDAYFVPVLRLRSGDPGEGIYATAGAAAASGQLLFWEIM